MARGPIDLPGHTNLVTCTIFTRGGEKLISTGWDATIRTWEVATAMPETVLTGHRVGIWSLDLDAGGTLLASGGADRTARLWDLSSSSEAMVFEGHTEAIYSVALSADGTVLATASSDRTVRVWDTATGRETLRLRHRYAMRCLALSRDGTTLVTACDRTYLGRPTESVLSFWELPSGTHVEAIVRDKVMTHMALTPSGDQVAISVHEGEPPDVVGIVELWDLAAHTMTTRWQVHEINCSSFAFQSDGTRLVTGSFDTTVKLWNIPDQTLQATFADQDHWVNGVAISADGRWLASGGGKSPRTAELRLWDLTARAG